ncbi:unnamed protein product [Microthlaspi erraticum]|uniref:Uncharacterized protein n=1 Tax=Microthlaspi erraticum TaxID=1685480 RepID=A0A6D2KRF4_9BRAS|nr:unnamed protein product [Microthlaspi erraticum]
MVTNVAMSSSSPEDIDCVVAVKFFGPQLSFCRYPGRSDSEWINLRISNPSFFSSCHVFQERRHVSNSRIWRPPYWIMGSQLDHDQWIHLHEHVRNHMKSFRGCA